MQNKGAIRGLAIAFALVCIFQLSFTWMAKNVEDKAKAYANGDVLKERAYLDSVSGQTIFNAGFKKYSYREIKEREINLGLDLKGGMNVTLEISLVDLVKNLANNSQAPAFVTSINKALEMQKNSQEDFVTLFGKAFNEVAPGKKLSSIFLTNELKDKVKYESTNEDVLKVIRGEANIAIENSYNIIGRRINKFGVSQPNIQRLANSDRILVELPGVKEPERVRALLQGTANLEFWETYDNKEIAQKMIEANTKLAKIKKGTDVEEKSDSTSADSAKVNATDKVVAKTDTSKKGGLNALLKDSTKAPMAAGDSTQKMKDENPLFQVMQPAVYQSDKGFYPGEGPVVGYSAVKDTAKVNAILADPRIKSVFPRDLKFLWAAKPYDKEGNALQLVAIRVTSRDGKAPLDGSSISDATGDFGQNTSKAEVSMSMNMEGAQTWARLTAANIKKSIAIVLDDRVYSFPTVQNEIKGGHSSITGNFTIAEAKDLATLLKGGKMPAPARIVEEAIVGPSLGQDNINKGLLSFVIALLLVLVFMGFYYSKAGWVANVALLANVFFIMGVLTSLGAVLTLPGIAGIVLTIGLSVDANILIFERIREELGSGKGLKIAIKDGYKNAMSSILDSNITTFLLGLVLFLYGSGPVQGFATTLMIGILTSLFSAIFITRLIFEGLLDKNKEIAFSIPSTANVFKNISFNFVGNRKKYYMFSGIIIIAGLVAVFTRGFDYGVDFEGGRSYLVKFENKVAEQDIRTNLAGPFTETPEVKTFGTDGKQVRITTTYLINENSIDADDKVKAKLSEGLKKLNNTYEVRSSQKVGPTIADDIKSSAVWAVLISCAIMFLYIFVRFKKWQYGLGAVAALIHDTLIVLSVYALLHGIMPFSLEIDQHFIAAILTVMGYSMTDTVVVFDRIREYLTEKGKSDIHGEEKRNVINMALNNTLSRTILTSSTIFLVLLAIFLFGGDVIRGFSFALLIGIVIGTYSSICIATPIVIDFDKNDDEEIKA